MKKEETSTSAPQDSSMESSNFLKQIIENDLSNKIHSTIITRFPPEPNGYLHLGHAKAICVNFGLAAEFGGRCHLRFDDTNPETEKVEYVNSIKEDIRWLGFEWNQHEYFASDYFQQLYDWAEYLIKQSKAYVCSLSEAELRAYRGDFTTLGRNSPFRERSVDENLDLFRRMKSGDFEEGTHVLRAKIDMHSPNMNMRDPLLYRIRKVEHHRTENKWFIYPMYDYAHPLSDAIEGITHSICTLEFQDHRPFYDWCIENLPTASKPRQYEFARMNMTYLVMSKRKLLQLVNEKIVSGWNDPRMPTLSGIRRRGYTPECIRLFAKRIGVSKAESVIDHEIFESSARSVLDEQAHRAMVVLNPLKIKLDNFEGPPLEINASIHPKRKELGHRKFLFTEELYIEFSDFKEHPGPDFHRLSPGKEVRLRNAFVIRCNEVVKDQNGKILELKCSILTETFGGKPPLDGRKIKGIIHWVSATHYISAEIRLIDKLFKVPHPEQVEAGMDFRDNINNQSMTVIQNAKLEESLSRANTSNRYQFERVGYFALDPIDTKPDHLVFNRIVGLGSPQK